jgi:mannose-6-phosphate isomerase-like protein (cupin superfamily)
MEIIKNNKKILAMILRKNYKNKGLEFFTPSSFSQQIAQMSYDKGKVIDCHYHRNISRKTLSTQEVLIIKSGKLKVLLFDKKKFFCSKILNSGDLILLASGGHGFKVLKKTVMIEVKQGPYSPKKDKIIFKSRKLS